MTMDTMLDDVAEKMVTGTEGDLPGAAEPGEEEKPPEATSKPGAELKPGEAKPGEVKPGMEKKEKSPEVGSDGKLVVQKTKRDILGLRKKAFEKIVNYYKDKPNLTDEDKEELVYKDYLNASRRINQEIRKSGSLEAKIKDVERYKKFHDTLEAIPEWQALKNKKARIVSNEDWDRLQQKLVEAGLEDDVPAVPVWAQGIMQRIDGLDQKLSAKEQDQAKASEAKAAKERDAKINADLEGEEKSLRERFPQFDEWIKDKEATGKVSSELQEILDMVEDDQVSLTYATKVYMMDHKLPEILESEKAAEIEKLKKKGKKTPESDSPGVETVAEGPAGDIESAASFMVEKSGT